ncbi:metal ABC transporter permease [Chlamydia psittaci]|uniref:metal ABC transporter permease n=1 Tax=Chlamydia psittaci TaxID=83554 RepID=UPI0002971CF6|nr:metal ABC transporter permease [Chlamydia psittaci]KPZ39499.1 iron ABC transporter [Chlamydia psittaci str. Frances]MBE3636329.1 metal ABC transporter permease [Chlamydia psittaci]BEU44116.1 metal ABC transporter permease [Chlamydia psittaci]CCO01947.1 ABC transporter, membrane permease [Chlamydia psittaci 01DC12]
MIGVFSPYHGVSFLQFLEVFFSRTFSGELFWGHLFIDDIQVIIFLAIALSGAFVGTFLVLKKMAMYANSVSHTVLFGLVSICLFTHQLTALSLGTLTLASVSTALLTGFLIYFIRNIFRVSEEASTALVFSLLFSMSLLLLVFLTRNAHIGTELILGNADSLTRGDIFPVYTILCINLLISLVGFRSFVCVSFDSVFSFSLGIPVKIIDYVIILQLSASLVGAFKAVGVLMALAFLLIPGLIAKVFVSSVRGMLVWSLIFGALTAVLAPACSRAILTSYGVGLSTSGIAVFILMAFYVVVCLFHYGKTLVYKKFYSKDSKNTELTTL